MESHFGFALRLETQLSPTFPGKVVVKSHEDILWLESPGDRMGAETYELGKHQENPLRTILKLSQVCVKAQSWFSSMGWKAQRWGSKWRKHVLLL